MYSERAVADRSVTSSATSPKSLSQRLSLKRNNSAYKMRSAFEEFTRVIIAEKSFGKGKFQLLERAVLFSSTLVVNLSKDYYYSFCKMLWFSNRQLVFTNLLTNFSVNATLSGKF